MSLLTAEPGFYPNIPSAEYHQGLQTDPRPLSSTLAKNLIRKLPAEAKWELENSEVKDAYDMGTAIHELILEGDLKTVVELQFDSYRTKDAQNARELARLDGKTPMLTEPLAGVRTLAEKVRADPEVLALLSTGGTPEMSALAAIDGIPVQARYDYLRLPDDTHKGYVLDLKTVGGSAAPRDFMRNGATYGYHIQAALYLMALEALGYRDLPYFWLVVSKEPPYAHSIIQASEADLTIGRDLVYTALERWETVLRDGWPTSTPITQSAFPMWTSYEAMEHTK